jgi:hypothetical protein
MANDGSRTSNNSDNNGVENPSSTLSYLIVQEKPSTHRMCAQDQLFHTHGHKVFKDSQMSRIKYIYYTNNVFKN